MEGKAMRTTSANPIRGQRGDAILEALIGMMLMAIVGLGLGYASARATLSQRYLNTQNVVISNMREQLMSSSSISSFCSGQGQSVVKVGSSSTALNLNCQNNTAGSVNVSVGQAAGGLAVALPADALVTTLTLSTPENSTSSTLFGGDGIMQVQL
jgi:prepilin peptidase dependent protein A